MPYAADSKNISAAAPSQLTDFTISEREARATLRASIFLTLPAVQVPYRGPGTPRRFNSDAIPLSEVMPLPRIVSTTGRIRAASRSALIVFPCANLLLHQQTNAPGRQE